MASYKLHILQILKVILVMRQVIQQQHLPIEVVLRYMSLVLKRLHGYITEMEAVKQISQQIDSDLETMLKQLNMQEQTHQETLELAQLRLQVSFMLLVQVVVMVMFMLEELQVQKYILKHNLLQEFSVLHQTMVQHLKLMVRKECVQTHQVVLELEQLVLILHFMLILELQTHLLHFNQQTVQQ